MASDEAWNYILQRLEGQTGEVAPIGETAEERTKRQLRNFQNGHVWPLSKFMKRGGFRAPEVDGDLDIFLFYLRMWATAREVDGRQLLKDSADILQLTRSFFVMRGECAAA